jgi:hypothetical protein
MGPLAAGAILVVIEEGRRLGAGEARGADVGRLVEPPVDDGAETNGQAACQCKGDNGARNGTSIPSADPH